MAIKLTDIDPEAIIDKDIFQLLGLENSSEADKKQVMDDMLETIQNRVVARLYDALGEEASQAFEKLVDEGDDAKVADFLKQKGIDTARITTEEALFYKTEILTITGKKDIL